MKRQGSKREDMVVEVGKNHIDTRKKSKRAVEAEEKGEVVLGLQGFLGWEEWPWLRGGAADEQMSWASVWLPLWDVHFVDKAYAALFNDVAWDDDIWNLKTVMVIPN